MFIKIKSLANSLFTLFDDQISMAQITSSSSNRQTDQKFGSLVLEIMIDYWIQF